MGGADAALPESQRLDHVCARGELARSSSPSSPGSSSPSTTRRRSPGPTRFGEPAQVLAPALDNFATLRARLPGQAPRLDALEAWTRAEFARIEPTLAARKAGGRIRECHGDLHLGNLVLLDGQVCPFDCIEFSDDLRWIDVASELAFTYMDLLDHRRPDLAAWLLDAWLRESGDFQAVPVLRFYSVYKALVRAKVAALGGAPAQASGYLALAESIATPPPPRLTITFGLSGSGKTTQSSALLRSSPGATTLRLRSDVERKRLHGLAPSSAATRHRPAASTPPRPPGAPTPCSTTPPRWCSTPAGRWSSMRPSSSATSGTASAPWPRSEADFAILACSAPLDEMRHRLETRQHDASEATVEVLERQLDWVEPWLPTKPRCASRCLIQNRAGAAPGRKLVIPSGFVGTHSMRTPHLLHTLRMPLAGLLLTLAAAAHAGPGGPTPTTAAAGS
jgi:predicted kinase